MNETVISDELKAFFINYNDKEGKDKLFSLIESLRNDGFSTISIENNSLIIKSKGEKFYFFAYIIIPLYILLTVLLVTSGATQYLIIVLLLSFPVMLYRLLTEKMIYSKAVTVDIFNKTITISSKDKFIKRHSKLLKIFWEFVSDQYNFVDIDEFFISIHQNYFYLPQRFAYVVQVRLKNQGVITICVIKSKKIADEFSHCLNYIVNNNRNQV